MVRYDRVFAISADNGVFGGVGRSVYWIPMLAESELMLRGIEVGVKFDSLLCTSKSLSFATFWTPM